MIESSIKEGVTIMNTVLEVANVEKYYGNKSNLTKALDGISFSVEEGEFVGSWERREAVRQRCSTVSLRLTV